MPASPLRPFTPAFQFVRWRIINFAISLALFLGSAVSIATIGLNYGLDFTGGISIQARSAGTPDLAQIRERLDSLRIGETHLQQMDDPRDILIRMQIGIAVPQQALADIRAAVGAELDLREVEIVGPTVGAELLRNGLTAAALAALGIGVYIWYRFEWRFGLSALVRTIHELFVTVGFFAVCGLEFNLNAIAALLALAGLSINDTVVVFDRIREVLRRSKSSSFADVIDLSINQTLRRTTILSLALAGSMLPLLLLGGHRLFNMSAALVWGIALGTYTSIFVAGPLLLHIAPRKPAADPAEGDEQADERERFAQAKKQI